MPMDTDKDLMTPQTRTANAFELQLQLVLWLQRAVNASLYQPRIDNPTRRSTGCSQSAHDLGCSGILSGRVEHQNDWQVFPAWPELQPARWPSLANN
jgi:hypothetical protein